MVPIDLAACGKLAQSSVPRIEQVFVESDDADTDAFERYLELAAKDPKEDANRNRAAAEIKALKRKGNLR